MCEGMTQYIFGYMILEFHLLITAIVFDYRD
jgi:hypothetical protein